MTLERSREASVSALPDIDQDADPAFSTENKNPFRSFDSVNDRLNGATHDRRNGASYK